jgi:glycosyltransferase involved in cell wall biosynthesis
MPLRVLVLSSEYAQTGSSVRAEGLARALGRSGADAEFLQPPPAPLPFRAEMLGAMARYLAAASRCRYDVIISVKPYPSGATPALLKPRQTECLSIIDVDDLDFAYRTGWRSTAIRTVQAPYIRGADVATCHNENLKKYLIVDRGMPPDRVWRVEQGVDTNAFNPESFGGQPCPGERTILNIGHFDAAADVKELIWALSMARDSDREITARLVGGGPLLSYYRALVKSKGLDDFISFTGPVGQGEVIRLVAEANTCTVFYARRLANLHRSSIKLREYLAMGKKVVCTNVGELSRFAPFTYQTDPDVAEFAEELVRAFNLGESAMHRRGRRYVCRCCSWDRIAAELLERLQGMIS